jgi:hypothetical protein
MIGPFRQRSSWPSSIATGLIGWIGFTIIVPLGLGYSGPLGRWFQMAVLAALVQVVVLRLAFGALKMDRGIRVGALWGGVTAALIVAGAWPLFPEVRAHPVIALVTGVYVGIPVGAFLSYFHRDDRKVEDEAKAMGKPVDYGRDAHWLDPFVYGAIAYEIALLPRSADLAISAAVVGMIVGVVAAGVSHFILSKWGNSAATIPAAMVAGAALGAPTGLLFRGYAESLLLPPLVVGAVAGALTFLATSIVGRKLAALERGA